MKAKKQRENSISIQLLKETSLKTRLSVLNHMLILSFMVDNGFIPDGYWTDEKEKKYGKMLRKITIELTSAQLKEIKDWEKDGRPK